MNKEVSAQKPARPPTATKDKVTVRGLNFFYGENHPLKDVSLFRSMATGDGVHRAVGLRQVDAAARAEPDVRALSGPARRRRDPARRREHSATTASMSTCCARASAWCSRSRRRSRCRSTTTSPSACGSTRGSPSRNGRPRRDRRCERAALWDEVKDKLNASGLGLSGGQQQRLCVARTVAISPEVILLDEPASALDPISTAKIEELIDELKERLHDRHRDPQHAAGRARLATTPPSCISARLVEFGETGRVFTSPRDKRTRTTSPAASARR